MRGGSIFNEAAQLYTALSGKRVPDGAFLEEVFRAILVHTFKSPLMPHERVLLSQLPNARRSRVFKVLAQHGIFWPRGESIRGLKAELYGEQDLEELVTDVSFSDPIALRASGRLKDRLKDYKVSTWPYLTPSPMTLADITYCFMHDVCPVSIIGADEINPAHGGLSCAAFADHDLFHQHVAEEDRSFYPFVSRILDEALEAGADGEAFLNAASPLLWGRYKAVMGIYHHLFRRMIRFADHDSATFNMANVGLFFLMHEHPWFESHIYDMQDPGEILDQHLDLVRQLLSGNHPDPDESPFLRTSPATGLSPLTDEGVFNALMPILAQNLEKHAHSFQQYDDGTGQPDMEKFRDFLQKNIRTVSLERTEWAIGMLVTLKDGHQVYARGGTRKLNRILLDDHRILLNMAGASIPKPKYGADEAENHQILKTHNHVMRQEIVSMLDAFKRWAHDQMTVGDFFTQYLHKAQADTEGDYARWYSFYKGAPQKTLVEPGIRTILWNLAAQKPDQGAFWMRALNEINSFPA